MPQMAPINWLILFILFSLSFLMFNMVNYYLYSPIMPKSFPIQLKNKSLSSWKW